MKLPLAFLLKAILLYIMVMCMVVGSLPVEPKNDKLFRS